MSSGLSSGSDYFFITLFGALGGVLSGLGAVKIGEIIKDKRTGHLPRVGDVWYFTEQAGTWSRIRPDGVEQMMPCYGFGSYRVEEIKDDTVRLALLNKQNPDKTEEELFPGTNYSMSLSTKDVLTHGKMERRKR